MKNKKYDFLIVGSGLFGCVFANLAKQNNQTSLIIEKRNHPFGNCYTENIKNINVHKYGPHIFHTSNENIWQFVNQFAKFNNYVNRTKVNYNNQIYSFPINLFTLHQLWGVTNPNEAKEKLGTVKIKCDNPSNLEEWILSQVGQEIYEKFIYGYTKKQWNIEPKYLPSSIIKRLPIRLNFDDNYFNDTYQGIPIGGYTNLLSNMTDSIEIVLNTDYLKNREYWDNQAKTIIYTGPIDEFYNYEFGKLNYRSLRFDHKILNTLDFQGNAIINYTSESIPFTRIVEHKHFDNAKSDVTIVTEEYPESFDIHNEPFYPINNITNNRIYQKYHNLSVLNNKFIFGGRLAQYKYFDMHQIIGSAINKYKAIHNESNDIKN